MLGWLHRPGFAPGQPRGGLRYDACRSWMACRAVARGDSPPAPVGLRRGSLLSLRERRRSRSLALFCQLLESGLPSRSSPATARLRPLGFGAAAFSRFASEGWWGKKDSNLRSHKTADLQSAPFATRDTPPFNHIASPAAELAAAEAMDDVNTVSRWRAPGRRVYGRREVPKSTKAGR